MGFLVLAGKKGRLFDINTQVTSTSPCYKRFQRFSSYKFRLENEA